MEHFVIQLFTGSVSCENCYLYSHGTMSSEEQLFKDILNLNVAELRRELKKNALPAAGRKAELIKRLVQIRQKGINYE